MPVSKRLSQLLDNMAPPERVEVETFAAFVVARRSLRACRDKFILASW